MSGPKTRHRRVVTAALLTTLLLLGACVADPPVTPVSDEINTPTTLNSQSPLFHDRLIAVRLRVVQCGLVATGSGFAIGPHTILTNRHMVAADSTIQIETWDGKPLHATGTKVSPDVDLAEITVSETLPNVAKLAATEPPSHAAVVTVGFPLGKQLKLASGIMIELLDGDQYDTGYQVMLTSAQVKHGNSGGPVVDETGVVVGVVFALSIGDNTGLAIPISVVHKTLDDDDFVPNFTCANAPAGALV